MADAAVSLGGKAAGKVADYARVRLLEQSEGQYNEDDVKAAILTELQLIKDDTKALRIADFKMARDMLQDWCSTPGFLGSDTNLHRLKTATECAARAFNTVSDLLDKLRAAAFLIYAVYHHESLTSSLSEGDGVRRPDWTSGKREAQQLLRLRVGGMKALANAAAEELGTVRRLAFANKEKRRKLLCAFVNLSASVYALHPVGENRSHPRFDQLEKAALRACGKKDKLMLSARVGHIISKPVEMGSLQGHSDYVNCCTVFGEGTKAISGSDDKTLKVWDLQSGQEIRTLTGHTGSVLCCAVFREGSRALSGSYDGTLCVWDLQSGQEIRSIRGHSGTVSCCSVYAEGSRALSGGEDGTLRVWDLESGKEMRALRGHTSPVCCCAVYGEGGKAISGSYDGMLKVWDLGSGQEIRSCQGHTYGITCCNFFADGTKAISGSMDNTLIWDLESGREIRTLQGHAYNVECCDIFPDGARAISGSRDCKLKVWDLLSGEEIYTLEGHAHSVQCCAIFSDGSRVLSGSFDGTLKVWDLPIAPPSQESRIVKAE